LRTLPLTIGFLALALAKPVPSLAESADLVAAGKALSTTCATCHGANGIAGMPNYPNLAGQKEGYLVAALKAYRAGKRTGGTAGLMMPVAKALSDEDIAALAKYYASLDPNG
jgi:cytochrome c553